MKAIDGLDPRDREHFVQIAALGRIGKRLVAQLEGVFDQAIRSADAAHKSILKIRNTALSRFEEAEIRSKEKLAQGRDAFPHYEADGATFSDNWRAEIVSEQEIPREFLVPDLAKINGVVKALKNETRIPGIKVVRRTQVALRANEQ